MELSPALISGAAGMVLSLFFKYVPGLNAWYASLSTTFKSLGMLIMLLVVSGFIALSSCLDWWVFITCDKNGILVLFETFVLALVANQSLYVITPDPKAVVVAKNNR